MILSEHNKNTRQTWEDYFADGWEKNAGRRQTQLFARYFLDTVRLPRRARTLLDVGCAMGDALAEFHRRCPRLKLAGCDVSEAAIRRAQADYGQFATFTVGGFAEIRGHHDIIYCSNTLEHFETNLEIARGLLEHCRWLYVLVPYLELKDGQRLQVEPGQWHVATFDETSFDPLVTAGAARRIRTWLHPCPVAWSQLPVPPVRRRDLLLRRVRSLVARPARPVGPAQIFYEIEAARVPGP